MTYQPNHVAAAGSLARPALYPYDLVVLSDIGANTLLLLGPFLPGSRSPTRWSPWPPGSGRRRTAHGRRVPEFPGHRGQGQLRNTALAACSRVLEAGDDREETPEGVCPRVLDMTHPVVAGLPATWPEVLGYQRARPKQGAEVVEAVGSHPLLVVGAAGRGRTAAFTSDMGPHWLPDNFVGWDGYARLWAAVRHVSVRGRTRGSGPQPAHTDKYSEKAVARP